MENILKAALLKEGKVKVDVDGTINWKREGAGYHDLLEIYRLLKSVNLNADQENLMERLSAFVCWAGKYPTPLKRKGNGDYRRKFLDSLVRGGEEEANQAETNYEQAKAQTDKDYEETAAAVAEKKQLTADEAAELSRLWKKLVKLYHPDHFVHELDKLETYHKLTAAINRAKDAGDLQTLREIAEDPHGYILRQGWARPVR